MSDTNGPDGDDDLPPDSVGSWHPPGRGVLPGSARDDAGPAACQALAKLYTDHYGSLVRLAALLTGDAACADDVAEDSFVALCSAGLVEAGDRAVSYLRRQVVIRSRHAASGCRTRGCAQPHAAGADPGTGCTDDPGCQSPASRFASLPVVVGLLTLSLAEREAIVLTSYLDLAEGQAAAAAGITAAALRRDLAAATKVLQALLSGDQS
jgi:DNA-directed RNA polymerase specialized sigma24 family protein